MTKLRVSFKGHLGQMSATSFSAILTQSLRVLGYIDRRISERRGGSIDWVIAGVRQGSVVLELAARPRPGVTHDMSGQVVRGFVGGIEIIEDIGETPAYFSQDDLVSVRDIVRQLGRDGISGIEYATDDEAPVELRSEAEAKLERLLGVRYRALGSVEGKIELVSIRRGSRRFNITEERTLKSVKCNLPDESEAAAIDAMRDRRRVVATGLVGFNGKDEAVSIELRKPLRFLEESEDLPRASDLLGRDPDITDGMLTEDYLRSLRDG